MKINKEGKSARELNRARSLRHYYRKMIQLKIAAGGKCVACEGTTSLVFHHKDEETKSFAIASNYGLSLPNLIAELEKCELRCIPCHKRVHFFRRLDNVT